MLYSLQNKTYDKMTEIITSVAVLISALSIRDAILYEMSKNEVINKLSPIKLSLLVVGASAIIIGLFMYPIRRFFTGKSSTVESVYSRFLDIIIGIVVLVSALSLRDASTVFFQLRREKLNRDKDADGKDNIHWKWSALVSGLTVVLILSILYDNKHG